MDALEAAATAQCRAVIVLAQNGRIGWATPPARRLLREWFAHDGGMTVPAQIEVWLAARRAGAGRLIPSAAPGPLRLERANRTLTVELLSGPELDGEALVTLNQRAVRGGQQLAALGLTPREAAVLTAAASGLGELGIGRELGISRRTVNKHLEHAYPNLDVRDRAHALAAAFGVPERGARARPGIERRETI